MKTTTSKKSGSVTRLVRLFGFVREKDAMRIIDALMVDCAKLKGKKDSHRRRATALERVAKDMLSTFRDDEKECLVTVERMEKWEEVITKFSEPNSQAIPSAGSGSATCSSDTKKTNT